MIKYKINISIIYLFFLFLIISCISNEPAQVNQSKGMIQTTDNPKKQKASLDIPFIGADVSYIYEPLNYVQSLAQANIRVYGADKVYWQDIEPDQTNGYQWDKYDAAVRNVEVVDGIILPTIWSISTWATEVPSDKNPSSKPKQNFRQNYYDFVFNFMERYDADDMADMPGLKRAHNFLQIEDEAQCLGDAWTASPACNKYKNDPEKYYRCAAREYGEMLKQAYQAAHQANPEAKVISFSFNFGDYFNNNPEELNIKNPRLYFLDEVFTNYSEYFDIIGIQSNYDYTGIAPSINYIQQIYKLDKPVMCVDAASMPLLGRYQFQAKDMYKNRYPFMTDKDILSILIRGSADSRYTEIISWWQNERAKLCVKKAVVAAATGAEHISFQFIMTGSRGQNVWTHADLLSAGPEYGYREPAGTPRPLVYALSQLQQKVDDFHNIKNLNPIPPGKDPYNWLWIYQLNNTQSPVYLVWTEAGEQVVDISPYVTVTKVKHSPIVTEIDNFYKPIYAQSTIVAATSIKVNSRPVLVEAVQ